MQFQPKTEKECQEAGLFQPGTYSFEVIDGDDKTSKAGNDMIELKVWLYGENGEKQSVFDYLLEAFPLKLRHAAYACGLAGKYEAGSLSAFDFKGKTGYAKVGIQKGKDGYADRNAITDYEFDEHQAAHEARAANNGRSAPVPELDDEIPF